MYAFCRCCIIEGDKKNKYHVTLRASRYAISLHFFFFPNLTLPNAYTPSYNAPLMTINCFAVMLCRTHPGKNLPVTDTEVLSVEDLKKSQVLRGYVSSVNDKGVFVR